ncbi:Uncharacterised protein [Chlamydia trachomatis]|nr:Uncharacterised protein [Chlamydia trachomatis]
MDVRQQRKVCVIGKQIYKNLFPGGGDPCGAEHHQTLQGIQQGALLADGRERPG